MRAFHPTRLRLRLGLLLLLIGLPSLAGCASFSFERLTLGATREQAEAVFVENALRRSAATLCAVAAERAGRTEVVVALLTPDRRVAAKFMVRRGPRPASLSPAVHFELLGEIEPRLAGYEQVGPIDTLRAIAADLSEPAEDPAVRAAHGWVAAALVRLVQRWPHVADEGPAVTRVQDYLDRTPIGGEARLTATPDGRFLLRYEAHEGR